MFPLYCSRESNNNTNNTHEVRVDIGKDSHHYGGGQQHNRNSHHRGGQQQQKQ